VAEVAQGQEFADFRQETDRFLTNSWALAGVALPARAAAARAESQTKVQELETRMVARDKSAEAYLPELERDTALFQGLKVEKEQVQGALSAAEQQRQAELLEAGNHNPELLGLIGRLERVAILLAAAGSMREATSHDGGDRWTAAQQIAATWLKHRNGQRYLFTLPAAR
jgi:hypothetical protein